MGEGGSAYAQERSLWVTESADISGGDVRIMLIKPNSHVVQKQLCKLLRGQLCYQCFLTSEMAL